MKTRHLNSMVRFRGSHLLFTCIIAWSSEIFRSTDGSAITWLEPPPSETITHHLNITEANKSLVEGSLNAGLSCNFSLSADLSIITTSIYFGGTPVANFAQSQKALSVSPGFESRFNVTWVPNKLTLIFFQVTSADEGEFRCDVLTLGSSGAVIQTWSRKIQVSLHVPPSITEITGNTVIEGENVTLHCPAKGTPDPSTAWTRLSDDSVVTMPLINISRHDVRDYRCTADNGVGSPATKDVFIDVQYPPEVNGSGHNFTVARGVKYTFSCPVDGNPDPNITWYSETGAYTGKQFKTGQNGCYTCVARNVHGISDNTTQCLIINSSSSTVAPTTDSSQIMISSTSVSLNPSRIMASSAKASQSPSSSSTTAPKGQEIEASMTIMANYEQAFKDLNSASSKEFVAKFEQQMDKVYTNMPEYIRTKVTQLRPGSVIVYFILYFKTAVTPEKGIENLRIAISSNGTFGDFQAKDLILMSEESTTSTKTTEFECSCSDNEITLMVVIAVLGVIIILLVAVIIWQQRKLRGIQNKR